MKITVRDCLELSAFKPCMVAAGKRNLDNAVRSVSVMDARDVKTALKENGERDQLVLTSFSGMEGNRALQRKVIKGLAGAGIGALVIFNAKDGLKEEDAETLEMAEALGLPLVFMTKGNNSKYSEVIEQVMDKLLMGLGSENNLINNTIYHLLDFERHTSFHDALREAAVSNEFQVVLISKDFNPILVVETRHRTSVSDAVRMLKKRTKGDTTQVYSVLEVEGIAAYWGDIDLSGEKYFLLIVDNEDQYSAVDITKLAEIIELAAGMWKYTPERDLKVELIKALTRGNRSLAYTLKDEMGIDGKDIVSVFYTKGLNNEDSIRTIDAFEEQRGAEVLMISEGEEAFGIILSNGKCDRALEPKGCCVSLFNELKEQSKEVRIFHVTGIDNLEGAAEGFSLINETWTFVESVLPYKRVFSKYELVLVSNCISIQVQGGHIKRYYADLLGSFNRELGENKAKQLLDTLETFVLDAGMNSGTTAKLMGIHANTVQYRLKRINEILGAEITGNRVIPGLTIALALKRLERVVN